MSRLKLSKKLQLNDTRPAGVLQLMKDNLDLMAPCDAAIAEAAATPAEAARLFKQSDRSIMGTSTKVELGEGFGYYTSVLYLAPAKLSGYEVCGGRSVECTKGCLSHKSGHLAFHQAASIFKTWWFFSDKEEFQTAAIAELHAAMSKAKRKGFEFAIRMNGTSDIPFKRVYQWAQEHNVQCYEYTKLKAVIARQFESPDMVHRTYSIDETKASFSFARTFCELGGNASIVIPSARKAKEAAIATLKVLDLPIVDGDEHDLRFRDPIGAIAYLKAKGIPSDHPMVWTAGRISHMISYK
tara:strand:- start:559 stop:1449 length:891 start_codon:yes stop_codon:yes gene_type:complete